ncbi:hypothetical protein G6F51_014375 [Rhizopus arrhizus]|uniref:Uncharacterized protein n=1 Tax=Rhizopus oryzae TaxID=64495 RepID=A0A9P6XME7_RHIOR|nr:hypothetical protein G6F51_014375 [Rhizopus arrhizus]
MRVALGGDLRQVGDAQHLMAFTQFTQQFADRFRHRAADAAGDFVENQRGHAGRAAGDDGQRQRDARQFAA